jgi:hypothetical protein
VHLDAAQLSFLTRLGKSPEGQQLQMLISVEIKATNEQLRKLSGEALLREQGKAIFLDEFMLRMTRESAPLEPRRPRPIDSSA